MNWLDVEFGCSNYRLKLFYIKLKVIICHVLHEPQMFIKE